jgi:hypothetical protein
MLRFRMLLSLRGEKMMPIWKYPGIGFGLLYELDGTAVPKRR